MKAKRSVYNLIFGFGSQLITMALGIVLPRLFLVNFGSEVNGFMASIGQVFIYMALLEAGVGAASLQALYRPVSKDDKREINSILAATSIYYRKAGIYYFFFVILFALTYPFVVDTNLDNKSVIVVILLTGMAGALRFYFQGKYTILLSAEGKSYITTSILTITNIITSIIKIILLLKGYNIIVIQISYFGLTIIQLIIFYFYITKNYKWLDLNVKPNFKAVEQKNSALIHQISSLVFSNTDILILTIFCDLKVVSVYVIYNLIFSMVDSVIYTVNSSLTFVLGQAYHECKEKYKRLYDLYEVYFLAFVFSIFTITYILILPFMRLYTQGLNDINYIDFWLPVLFVILKLLSYSRSPAGNAIAVAGHFKNTQNRSLLETILNLTCSLFFVNLLGIYGVLLGTILALIYRSIDMVIYSNIKILHRSPFITTKRLLTNSCLFLAILIIQNIIVINPTSYIGVFVWSLSLLIIITPLYLLVIAIFEREAFSNLKFYLDLIFKRFYGHKRNLNSISKGGQVE